MKTTITIEKEIEVKTLSVHAGVRYWEDATVNGIEDTEGNLIPCREGDYWCPDIDIDTGKILNWKIGTTAEIHYKICDDGSYYLKDENGKIIMSIENDYVPYILCPKELGYGDYIIMDVEADGQIKDWNPDLDGFEVKQETEQETEEQ